MGSSPLWLQISSLITWFPPHSSDSVCTLQLRSITRLDSGGRARLSIRNIHLFGTLAVHPPTILPTLPSHLCPRVPRLELPRAWGSLVLTPLFLPEHLPGSLNMPVPVNVPTELSLQWGWLLLMLVKLTSIQLDLWPVCSFVTLSFRGWVGPITRNSHQLSFCFLIYVFSF